MTQPNEQQQNQQPQAQPVYMVPAPVSQQPRPPSTVRLVDDRAQVVVDTWGHRGEFVRGQILERGEAEQAGFDWDHALRVGAIRQLTEAEARQGSVPGTMPLNLQGEADQDFIRAMRFHSGMSDTLPETVTTEQGPPEPPQFAKPTIEYQGPNQEPPARPVRVASAQEAERAGAEQPRIVPTPSGPAFATREEQEEILKREEQGQSPSQAERGAAADLQQEQSVSGDVGNISPESQERQQRVVRRGRRE
jgi:hypothetical protein